MSCVALGGLPASAEAGWRLDRANAIAEIVWHQPCGDVPAEIAWEPLDAEVTAAVRDSERPPYPRCRIRFNSAEPLDWMSFCSYTLHEYGHLAGFRDPLNAGTGWSDTGHRHNPGSIMAEFFDNDRRCRTRGRPYLEAQSVVLSVSAQTAQSHRRFLRVGQRKS